MLPSPDLPRDPGIDALLRSAFRCTDRTDRSLVECFLGKLVDGRYYDLPLDLRKPTVRHLRTCPRCAARVLGACQAGEFRRLTDTYLGELAIGPATAIAEEDRLRLEAHLDSCVPCRMRVREARVALAVRHSGPTSDPVPALRYAGYSWAAPARAGTLSSEHLSRGDTCPIAT